MVRLFGIVRSFRKNAAGEGVQKLREGRRLIQIIAAKAPDRMNWRSCATDHKELRRDQVEPTSDQAKAFSSEWIRTPIDLSCRVIGGMGRLMPRN